jgi:hypothetical protein
VPVEAARTEAGLDVDPRLVDVHVGAEDLPGAADHALVAYELGEDLTDLVDLEDRADLLRLRLDDRALVGADRRVRHQALQLRVVERDLVLADDPVDGEETVTLVRLQVGPGDRPGVPGSLHTTGSCRGTDTSLVRDWDTGR